MTISSPRGNRWRYAALAVVLVLIGWGTLRPGAKAVPADIAILCLRCGDLGGPDLILNVGLFVPLGLALSAFGIRPLRALGIGFALSAVIEVVQLLLPGRYPTLRDALCNASGAWLGAWCALRHAEWVRPSRTATLRLGVVTLGAVAIVGITGVAFGFGPSPGRYFAHWSPDQAHLEHWTGTVLEARLDGAFLPSGPVDAPERLRADISDGFVLELRGIGGRPTSSLGGIIGVSDAQDHEVFLIGPDGTDLVVNVRRHAARFRFGGPEARFAGLLGDLPAGAPLTLRVESSASRTCATVNGTEACAGRPAAGSSWILLFTDRGTRATARILLNVLTLGMLAFPVGLLLGSVPLALRSLAVLLLVTGMAAAARLSGLAAPTLVEWAGLAAGLVAGAVLDRLVRSGAPPVPTAPA